MVVLVSEDAGRWCRRGGGGGGGCRGTSWKKMDAQVPGAARWVRFKSDSESLTAPLIDRPLNHESVVPTCLICLAQSAEAAGSWSDMLMSLCYRRTDEAQSQ